MRRASTVRCALFALIVVAAGPSLSAADADAFKVKRDEIFEFTEKPALARRGGHDIEISFASKGNCDVTIAIEDAQGKIIRHLVSGVLGPNAPEPLQKNSTRQNVVWDGKDENGVYIDRRDDCVVRVSLGLNPRFERTLFWDPRRRLGSWEEGSILYNTATPLVQPAPDGVYVFEARGLEQLRLFDHKGQYIRTIYPFPSDKLKSAKGLTWRTLPLDEQAVPVRSGFAQATLLTSGTSCILPGGSHGGGPSTSGTAALAMVLHQNRIGLVFTRLNRLCTDGTTGGMELEGPATSFPEPNPFDRHLAPVQVGPTSAAISPDGKWIYLTGYTWGEGLDTVRQFALHKYLQGVARIPYEGTGEMTTFAGQMTPEATGSEPGKFVDPTSVACDAEGRVYVSDYMNDRIQVFSPEGKFLKSIAAVKPARVQINPKTREIFVFSWLLPTVNMRVASGKQPIIVKPSLTRLASFDDPKVVASYALPLHSGDHVGSQTYYGGLEFMVQLDPYADPPTLWMVADKPKEFDIQGVGLQLYELKDKELVKLRDFSEEAVANLGKSRLPVFWRQRLYANPKTGMLYIAEGHCGPLGKNFHEMVEINPAGGKPKLIQLPFDAEDLAFDADGYCYMRDYLVIGRYNPADWSEVPFDYGEERQHVSADHSSGRREATLSSALELYSGTLLQKGGLSVSPRGNVLVSCYVTKDNPAPVAMRKDEKPASLDGNETLRQTGLNEKGWPEGVRFQPQFYPGRFYWGEVHVFDKHGKILYGDAVPGITELFGIAQDRDDNIYVLSTITQILNGTPYPNEKTGTLMKFKPGKAHVMCGGEIPNIPIKLAESEKPHRPPDGFRYSEQYWIEGADWKYGGVGFCGKNSHCSCWNCRFALDYFARSFVPEVEHFSVAIIDTGGNLILRVGRYGNIDDGRPLDPAGGPPEPRSLGGDEVGLFYAPYLATLTDQRLFIADPGNGRILSVKLEYHASEQAALKDAGR